MSDRDSWQALGAHQYRTVRLYERMRWGEAFELEDYTVCGAPYGGPLALATDTRKLTTLRGSSERISLYDAAGKLVRGSRVLGSNLRCRNRRTRSCPRAPHVNPLHRPFPSPADDTGADGAGGAARRHGLVRP
jgi:hypothetical protein